MNIVHHFLHDVDSKTGIPPLGLFGDTFHGGVRDFQRVKYLPLIEEIDVNQFAVDGNPDPEVIDGPDLIGIFHDIGTGFIHGQQNILDILFGNLMDLAHIANKSRYGGKVLEPVGQTDFDDFFGRGEFILFSLQKIARGDIQCLRDFPECFQ
jgi:hypothetical protein